MQRLHAHWPNLGYCDSGPLSAIVRRILRSILKQKGFGYLHGRILAIHLISLCFQRRVQSIPHSSGKAGRSGFIGITIEEEIGAISR